MPSPKPKPSSYHSHRAAGRKPRVIVFDVAADDLIQAAAKAEGRPVTQFVAHHAAAAAKKVLAREAVTSAASQPRDTV